MSIELKNVTYTYSQGTAYESHALKDINLVIPDGQFIGVIGHTGSGKSTLIQHFNALIQPTSGQILYNGEDVWAENYNRRALRSEVGLVFQYPEHKKGPCPCRCEGREFYQVSFRAFRRPEETGCHCRCSGNEPENPDPG